MQKCVAMSGKTGFIGSYLSDYLQKKGHEVRAIPRYLLEGDPSDLAAMLEGADVVIHLAGAPILGRWTRRYRKMIRDSRIRTTRHLVTAMERMERPPTLFISASGVNIYPFDGVYTERDTVISSGFLGEVCRDWELEALRANAFMRTVVFRFGMVLGRGGGALKTMARPFRLGMGGRIGHGRQMMSWVHIEDLARAVRFVMHKHALHGPINMSSPQPVSNREFTRALARSLKRPAFFTVPPFALRLLYGEGASIITRGTTVLPRKLQKAGFQFRYPAIEWALAEALG